LLVSDQQDAVSEGARPKYGAQKKPKDLAVNRLLLL